MNLGVFYCQSFLWRTWQKLENVYFSPIGGVCLPKVSGFFRWVKNMLYWIKGPLLLIVLFLMSFWFHFSWDYITTFLLFFFPFFFLKFSYFWLQNKNTVLIKPLYLVLVLILSEEVHKWDLFSITLLCSNTSFYALRYSIFHWYPLSPLFPVFAMFETNISSFKHLKAESGSIKMVWKGVFNLVEIAFAQGISRHLKMQILNK